MKKCVLSLVLWYMPTVFCSNTINIPPSWKQPSSTWKPVLHLQREKKIVFVVPSYKNAQWYTYNLDSMFAQQYQNYRVIYIDDYSPDGTADLVAAYVKEHQQEHRFTLIRNTERRGALANIYDAVHSCADDEIIAQLDGDDWLACNNVLSILNEAYEDPSVWMTYGQFLWYPSNEIGVCKEIPQHIIVNHAYRRYVVWVTSQLRTFYAQLFKKIKREDLLYQGKFYPMAWDVAYMIPMLEMANGRHQFIPHITYVYNCITPLNDHKTNRSFQMTLDYDIRVHHSVYEACTDIPFIATANKVAAKIHEQWWSKTIGKQRSQEWFDRMVGDQNAPSRLAICDHIKLMNYQSILDVACSACVDAANFKRELPNSSYLGVDITQKFVEYAHQRGINALCCSVEQLPLTPSSFEVCSVRHLLEHLDYYEKAVDELIRVAQKEVMIVFFIKPDSATDSINYAEFDGSPLYHNCYNKSKLEDYLRKNKKVKVLQWQDIGNEIILHVYV